jgi:hypothetical protein
MIEVETYDPRSVLRAVGAGALLLLSACVLARIYFTIVDRSIPAPLRWVASSDLARAREIREVMPELAAGPDGAAYLLGPSLGYYGFHPDVFDAQMATHGHTIVSHNLAIIGNVAQTDGLIAKRLRDAYRKTGKRAALVMPMFSWLAADAAYLERDERSHLRKRALLSTPGELALDFLDDPHLGSEMAALRIFDGTMAEDANHVIGKRLFAAPSWWPATGGPDQGSAWKKRAYQIQLGYKRQLGRYDRPTRGMFNPLDGNDPAAYAELKQLAWSDDAVTMQSRAWADPDFVDAVLVPERIDAFVGVVATAREFADAVVIVVPPISEGIKTSELGRERIAAAVADIGERTGAPIVDLSQRGFVRTDFIDFSHLNYDEGAPKFSRMLADEVAPLIDDGAH